MAEKIWLSSPHMGGNELKYILTSKTFIDKNNHDETELLTTESMFNQFRQMSESGMIKHRCELKIEGDEIVKVMTTYKKKLSDSLPK